MWFFLSPGKAASKEVVVHGGRLAGSSFIVLGGIFVIAGIVIKDR